MPSLPSPPPRHTFDWVGGLTLIPRLLLPIPSTRLLLVQPRSSAIRCFVISQTDSLTASPQHCCPTCSPCPSCGCCRLAGTNSSTRPHPPAPLPHPHPTHNPTREWPLAPSQPLDFDSRGLLTPVAICPGGACRRRTCNRVLSAQRSSGAAWPPRAAAARRVPASASVGGEARLGGTLREGAHGEEGCSARALDGRICCIWPWPRVP